MPNVPALSRIWAPGAESGKRFARVYSRLLVADSHERGIRYHAVDDSSGDYRGVDGYSERGFLTTRGKEGFSFKFYPSPLKDPHKTEIKESLKKAVKAFPDLCYWILCTPDTFRPEDLEWFEKLEPKKKSPLKTWHWGFEEFLGLLQKHPQIGREVYPNLFAATEEERKHAEFIRDRVIRPLIDELDLFGAFLQFQGPSYRIGEHIDQIKSADVRVPVRTVRIPKVLYSDFMHNLRTEENVLLQDFLDNHFSRYAGDFATLEKELRAFSFACASLVEDAAGRILQISGMTRLADWETATPPRLFHLNAGDFVTRRLLSIYGGGDELKFNQDKVSYKGGDTLLFTGSAQEQDILTSSIQQTQDSLDLVQHAHDIHRKAGQYLQHVTKIKMELDALAHQERLPGECRYG